MKNYLLNQKLKSLTGTIHLVLTSQDSVNTVHQLRKETRELLSLVSKQDPFYPQLKKIIKLSNEIRDLDVFFATFLTSLKPNYQKSLKSKEIAIHSIKQRKKLFARLCFSLQNLPIPSILTPKKRQNISPSLTKKPLFFEQKSLHKYRITIKNILYSLEHHSEKKDKKKIKILTQLKDLLGKINDNFNGIKRLDKFQLVERKIFKKIKQNTLKKNTKYFHKVQKLHNLL